MIDMNMPVMDGCGFVRVYRLLPGHQARLVLMTAGHSGAQTAQQLGVDRYLAKPFELDDVLRVLGELTKRRS